MSIEFSLGQLRHLYSMMIDGRVKDTRQAAVGLLGPVIVDLERAKDSAGLRIAALERELERWRHNQMVEGDYVCPDSLELNEAKNEIERLKALLEKEAK